ncbi:MAG: CYTH domain-containing protein, partial [Thermoleophilia bacterium]
MEIEAKFSAPDAATLARLGELDELAGYEVAGHEVADMTDVYLDTDDRALRSAGLVCRRRDRGDRVVVTVKRRGDAAVEHRDAGGAGGDGSGAGGASEGGANEGPGADAIHRRDEWETELPDGLAPDAPPGSWPAGEVRERVLAAAGDRPLAALVEVGQSRVLRTVSKGGRTVAELSLDTFTIVTGDGALAPQYEVEAELKGDGAEADLGVIAGALQRDFALTPQPLSKFERAMAALAVEPSPAGLLSDDQERLLARISRRTDAVGRRAQVLLALNEGALQRDAAARARMAPRTVRYWLNRFRREGLAIFPRRLVAGSPGTAPRPAAVAAAATPAAAPTAAAAAPEAAPAAPAKAPKLSAATDRTARKAPAKEERKPKAEAPAWQPAPTARPAVPKTTPAVGPAAAQTAPAAAP